MIQYQDVSIDVWSSKYRLKNKNREYVEQSIDDTFSRVSRALSDLEPEESRDYWYKTFLESMNLGCVPAGRILANAGANEHKTSVSTINCTVSGAIHDSMEDILEKLRQAGITLKYGCGIGYEFSTLRPRGFLVMSNQAYTNGPLAFMDIFDKMCFTVASAGGRRGAQMATFDVSHPDILEYIEVKKEPGRLRQFNLSVLISDKFMKAVENDEEWQFIWDGKPTGNPTKARHIWDLITMSTYERAEPGVIFVDKVNRLNNNWFCENIRASNPCFSGDTKVIAFSRISGEKIVATMEQLDGKEFLVPVLHNKKIVLAEAFCMKTNKESEVVKVELSNGQFFRCTPDHLIMNRAGNYIQAKDLKSGTSLMPMCLFESDSEWSFANLLSSPSNVNELIDNYVTYLSEESEESSDKGIPSDRLDIIKVVSVSEATEKVPVYDISSYHHSHNFSIVLEHEESKISGIVAHNCFAGDTLIATADGRQAVPLAQLASEGKDVLVYCHGNGGPQVRMGRSPRKTGTKQLYKVTLDDGSCVRVTENHKWILSNYDTKTTLELKPDDSLLRFDRRISCSHFNSKTMEGYYFINDELEHRLIGSYNLGRELLPYPKEIAHHIDENIYNNSPSNIKVISQASHNSEHYKDNSYVFSNGHSNKATVYDFLNLMYTMISQLDRFPMVWEFKDACKNLGLGSNLVWSRSFGEYENLLLYFFYSDVYRDTSQYKKAESIEVVCEFTGEKFIRKDPRTSYVVVNQLGSSSGGKKIIRRNFKTYGDYLTYHEKFEVRCDKCACDRNQGVCKAWSLRKMASWAIDKIGIHIDYANWDSFEQAFRNQFGGFISSKVAKQIYPTFSQLTAASEISNHKVVSIELDGIEDVYNITVDEFHNVGVITNLNEKASSHNNPRSLKNHSGIFLRQCGEQMLPPFGSCLLGSINLALYVKDPFTSEARFDFDLLREQVSIFSRMLDNVVEINNLPLQQQREEILRKRRHGMGFMGLGSAMIMLGMKYGSPESVDLTDKISRIIAVESFRTGAILAKEKGEAPILTEKFTITQDMIDKNENLSYLVDVGEYKLGQVVTGRELWILSHYFDNFRSEYPELMAQLKEHGCRYTHATSIAPTGTLSLSVGGNVSNGIEPSFMHKYLRNIVIEGKKTKEQRTVYSYELYLYNHLFPDSGDNLPNYFVTTDDLTPEDHVVIQAAAQKWVDSSISKTVNVPADIAFSDFQNVYKVGYENGLKGIATFRFNPDVFSGVLVKENDLASTKYIFVLDNGEQLEVSGNEEIFYDGEVHIAANLHDALVDKYYGKL